MGETFEVRVKWGRETYDKFPVTPSAGPSKLLDDLCAKTGVPKGKIKVMCNRVWKGALKDDMPDWEEAIKKGKWRNNLNVAVIGTAEALKVPEKQTVFMEDMSNKDKQKLETLAPPGLENLGNTCYMNSTLQCLKAIPELRKALDTVDKSGLGSDGKRLTAELASLFESMDSASDSVAPRSYVQLMRRVFPHLNAFNAQAGGFSQEDADEFLNAITQEMSRHLTSPVEDVEFGKQHNAIDALFGIDTSIQMKCTESDETGENTERLRRLQCMINENINTLEDGLMLGLDGQVEKRSDKLGRNAIWNKRQRLHRVPLYLTVQFNRFYWKKTPNSRDHQGVPCKIKRPVRFPLELDIYNFCDDELKAILEPARKKYTDKILAQGEGGDAMETGETEEDDELKAAMALSMNPNGETAGIGVPPSFRGIYELFGVVTHKGKTSKSGHYLGWVKQKDGKWMCFDDEFGSPCEEEDIMRLAGDGADWHIAYMAFFRVKE